MQPAVRLLSLGDAAWTLEFGQSIDAATHAQVLGLAQRLREARANQAWAAPIVDVVPTFRSVTVHFDPWQADADTLGEQLRQLALVGARSTLQGRQWCLPVCMDAEFSPDLERICAHAGQSRAQVIAQFLSATFHVYMIGFQPGFPYMGGLPSALEVPRLATPRQKVPAQSVAVALQMCAVYPWESPGGWNLLGRTPVRLFDPQHAQQPAMLAAGDQVRWQALERAQYDRLVQDLAPGLPRDSFCEPATP